MKFLKLVFIEIQSIRVMFLFGFDRFTYLSRRVINFDFYLMVYNIYRLKESIYYIRKIYFIQKEKKM